MKTTEWINGRSALAVLMGVLMLPAWAAESAPPAAQPVVAEDAHAAHAAHDDHAAHGVMPDVGGRGEGAPKPSSWTAFPLLKTKTSGESRERRVTMVIPEGMAASRIDAYSNNLDGASAHRQLPLEMAGAKLGKLESGGFHWLAAREEQDGQVSVASTVHYSGERGAENPGAMFVMQKHELEIIPQPYPREHSRYRANEEWQFLVHFNGKPLTNHKLFMETANGSRVELTSDARGIVTARIPDDFDSAAQAKKPGAHDHGRRGADFVLAAEHADGGKTYLTAFNASYGPDAFDQRSLALGLGFTLLGMAGAAPLLRHRKAAKAGTKNEEI